MPSGARTILTPKVPATYDHCEELEAMLKEMINQHKTEVILDCKAVPFIDSAGLELLVGIDRELHERGGTLKIVGLNEVCKDILVATRLIDHLYVYADVHEAIRNGQ